MAALVSLVIERNRLESRVKRIRRNTRRFLRIQLFLLFVSLRLGERFWIII